MLRLLVPVFSILLVIVSCTPADRLTVMDTLFRPVGFDQVYANGELLQRAMKNFDRLETDIYHPENVFPEHHHETSVGWPGYLSGFNIPASLKSGSICGSLSATRYGGIEGQPGLDELKHYLTRL